MNTPHSAIDIEVESQFLDEESSPQEDRYVFTYTITIRNSGDISTQLLTRRWVITDGHGQVHEVNGEGVVGERPHIGPGEAFRYTSGTVLETPVGTMEGSYQMLNDDGHHFDAPIPRFTLSQPLSLH